MSSREDAIAAFANPKLTMVIGVGDDGYCYYPMEWLGLQHCWVVMPNGDRGPLEGFLVNHEHSLVEALIAQLPDGARLTTSIRYH